MWSVGGDGTSAGVCRRSGDIAVSDSSKTTAVTKDGELSDKTVFWCAGRFNVGFRCIEKKQHTIA